MADQLIVDATPEQVRQALKASGLDLTGVSIKDTPPSDPFDSTSRGQGLDFQTTVEILGQAIAGNAAYDLVKTALVKVFGAKAVKENQAGKDDKNPPKSG